jgi:hypothetical protein
VEGVESDGLKIGDLVLPGALWEALDWRGRCRNRFKGADRMLALLQFLNIKTFS